MAITDPNILAPVNTKVIQDLVLILRGQGHKYTGALERSLVPQIDKIAGAYVLSATALDYIFDLEEGLPPNDPKFSRVDMAKLEAWVKFRRNQGHPTPDAKVLIKKWKKKGYELEGALLYADPEIGQVDKAIELTFSIAEQSYFEMIDQKVFQMFDDEVNRTKSETINSKSI